MKSAPQIIAAAALAAFAVACGPKGANKPSAASESVSASTTLVSAPAAIPASPAPVATGAPLAGRLREVASPDDATMILLYYSLSGLPMPVDRWAEGERKVQFAQPIDKAPLRAQARAEITTGAAAVRDIGLIRLTMDANLSDFDPSYNEFTVRALSPSSEVEFNAFGQTAAIRFVNGETAQRWSFAGADAQAARDRIEHGGVELVVLTRVTGASPAPDGGIINTEVLNYELRNRQSGTVIARVKVAD